MQRVARFETAFTARNSTGVLASLAKICRFTERRAGFSPIGDPVVLIMWKVKQLPRSSYGFPRISGRLRSPRSEFVVEEPCDGFLFTSPEPSRHPMGHQVELNEARICPASFRLSELLKEIYVAKSGRRE